MAIVKVLFFGVLTELSGKREEEIEATNLNELRLLLQNKYPLLKDYSFLISVNYRVMHENVALNDGDELAFLPPFAGG